MKELVWRSILQRVEGQRIVGLCYGLEDGYLRLELDDGRVLLVAASWEGCHVMVDPGVPATRKGRPTKEPPLGHVGVESARWRGDRGSVPLAVQILGRERTLTLDIHDASVFAGESAHLRPGGHRDKRAR